MHHAFECFFLQKSVDKELIQLTRVIFSFKKKSQSSSLQVYIQFIAFVTSSIKQKLKKGPNVHETNLPTSPAFSPALLPSGTETQISHLTFQILLRSYFLLLKYSSITSLACDSLP